ncbi:MAG TPA: siphovirus Gp157 family protein [Bryobacteraceae bacterium]|jgi:hypothetical protein|nr:siphovirus Gp157 family protein [Bryobacteraceae bacterium]
MSAALAPRAPSLFELEHELESLLDTEALVTPEQEAEFRRELASALEASVEKRDRVYAFLRHCELQAENCDAEIARLSERKRTFEAAHKRMRQYVQSVIESLGTDAKGKPKKLEGKTVTFSLRARPASVEITDELLVPEEYKSVVVKLPLEAWQLICDEFENDEDDPVWHDLKKASESASCTVSKTAIREAIESGVDVPGADLAIGGHTLVVK